MKVKIKKYWKVEFYHNTNENKVFEMIVYAKNIQKVVEEFYNKISSGWSNNASNYVIKDITKLEVDVNGI